MANEQTQLSTVDYIYLKKLTAVFRDIIGPMGIHTDAWRNNFGAWSVNQLWDKVMYAFHDNDMTNLDIRVSDFIDYTNTIQGPYYVVAAQEAGALDVATYLAQFKTTKNKEIKVLLTDYNNQKNIDGKRLDDGYVENRGNILFSTAPYTVITLGGLYTNLCNTRQSDPLLYDIIWYYLYRNLLPRLDNNIPPGSKMKQTFPNSAYSKFFTAGHILSVCEGKDEKGDMDKMINSELTDDRIKKFKPKTPDGQDDKSKDLPKTDGEYKLEFGKLKEQG